MSKRSRFLTAGCFIFAVMSLLNLSPRTVSMAATEQPTAAATARSETPQRRVFVVVMENQNWDNIKGSPSAPYINKTLLTLGAHAEQYYTPPGLKPSQPNYLWLEAGDNFGINANTLPRETPIASTKHLVTQLNAAGFTWKSYQEGIDGRTCPLEYQGLYAPKHNPMVFFEDVTDKNNPNSPYCIAHIRPYSELHGDLARNAVSNYSFITPDLCNDMHNANDTNCDSPDSIKNGDSWLATEIPPLLNSQAYRDGAIIIIVWDEGIGGDGPIGLIVLSQNVKAGYSNTIRYTHSSTLRTLQTIFGVKPFLGDAANATDLSDLFKVFP